MKLAVVGSGIAGMGAAWLLRRKYDVTVYEKNDYIGGHSRTIQVNYDNKPISVDTGFIVFNHKNYPNLTQLFKHLGVAVEKSDMSFGVSINGGQLEYSGVNAGGLLAQKANLFKPDFYKLLLDILKFNRNAAAILKRDENPTLGEYLTQMGMSDWFRKYYILPMGGAIWSTPLEEMLDYPAKTFIQFFEEHGLLTVSDQPQWYTVKGGSKEYIKKLTMPYKDNIQLKCGVKDITRKETKIVVTDTNGDKADYDHVVIAAHGDQALAMLKDADAAEKQILSSFKYKKNTVVVHRDPSLMPKRKAAWASWIYLANEGDSGDKLAVTYWMNKLQNIDMKHPLFVTMNPPHAPAEELTFDTFNFEHPVYDMKAIDAQKNLAKIQGKRNTWFVGSYLKYGFHEDAFTSALEVAKELGATPPWR
ncbi:MAG: FAD-dependent oxidoreductase [Proteobacteria bacterium]|nr:FAD-dependent oxidoreductase [Pseudomonadota bacterium]